MLFTTPFFLFVFLPLFLIIYYVSPQKIVIKNSVALFGSMFFFAWGEPLFVFVLLFTTYIDYHIARFVEPSTTIRLSHKKKLLALGIFLNVAMLIVSKYLSFVCAELLPWIRTWSYVTWSAPNFPLILGISFITFHKVSYLVDSYQGRAKPPRHFWDCALYIFLFPQLIAGPIIRYHDIGEQIQSRQHTTEGFLIGFLRFFRGLIKKLIIADTLGLAADKVFNLPLSNLSTYFAWGGILAYSLQIYFDFSGYSDMAIGLARMIGFQFPENFNRPYIATSITEFWQRWHMSLSRWMRLYLYIPLGGNRKGVFRTYLNLWIVFLISGFWHGASWTFVVWGAYYGFFLCLERLFSLNPQYQWMRPPAFIRRMLTLLVVMIGWVFFRSPSLNYAIGYIKVLMNITSASSENILPWGIIFNHHTLFALSLGLCLSVVLIPRSVHQQWARLKVLWVKDTSLTALYRTSFLFMSTAILMLIAAALVWSADYVPFLYFRF